MLPSDTLSHLVCPTCKGSLKIGEDSAVCESCQKTYLIKDGCVRFMAGEEEHPASAETDALMIRCKNVFKRFPKLYQVLVDVFGTSRGGLSPQAFFTQYCPANGIFLNLGSGATEKIGNALHVDLFPFAGVDIVADITNLPFADASVDALVCIQVLEHVPYPEAVLNEMRRVLKPGGVCYLSTPFLYPYHSSPHDYTRWTMDGLRALTHGFEELQGGLRHGPTSGLAIIFAQWLAAVFSFGSVKIFEFLSIVWLVCLAPFAHLFDWPLNRLRVSENIASGHYLVARKKKDVE